MVLGVLGPGRDLRRLRGRGILFIAGGRRDQLGLRHGDLDDIARLEPLARLLDRAVFPRRVEPRVVGTAEDERGLPVTEIDHHLLIVIEHLGDDGLVDLLGLGATGGELLRERRDRGLDLVRLERADRPPHAVPLVHAPQTVLQRLLRRRLEARIERGADLRAERVEGRLALLRDELLLRELHPLRCTAELGERAVDDLDRRVDPLLRLGLRELAHPDELVQHVGLALLRALGVDPRRDVVGRLRQACDQRGLSGVELPDVLAEVEPRRLLHAVPAVTEEDLVDVEGHDLLLGQRLLEPAREDDLLDLALERLLRREQERLDHLLGDRGGALLRAATGADVHDERAEHAPVVDAAVGPELVVLRGHERVDQDLRDLLVRDVAATLRVDLADPVIVRIEDLGDLLRVVVTELRVVGQVRIAPVHPEHERDRGHEEQQAREREDREPLEHRDPALARRLGRLASTLLGELGLGLRRLVRLGRRTGRRLLLGGGFHILIVWPGGMPPGVQRGDRGGSLDSWILPRLGPLCHTPRVRRDTDVRAGLTQVFVRGSRRRRGSSVRTTGLAEAPSAAVGDRPRRRAGRAAGSRAGSSPARPSRSG